jgi:sphingolipid delta-4 desaturase
MHAASSRAARWHLERQKEILRAHPEVRRLQGHFRGSAGLIAGLTLWQIGLAWTAQRSGSWAFSIALGYFVGSIGCHTLGVLIHECTHNLVAKTTRGNKLWAIVANFTMMAPGAIAFRVKHLSHHKFLAELDGRDHQAAVRLDSEHVRTPLAKALRFVLGPLFAEIPKTAIRTDAWVVVNWIASGVAWAFFIGCIGAKGIACLGIAVAAAFGLHPLGARRLSEHFATLPSQPTVSYYGGWNRLTLNVGYHVEHHDMPSIPWIHLETLRATAPEHYDVLWSFRSWWRLIFDWVTKRMYRVDHYYGLGRFLEPERVAALRPPERAEKGA